MHFVLAAPDPLQPRSLAAGAAVIVVGLLLLLYVYRRRPYILCWTAGWGLFAASMLTAGGRYQTATGAAFVLGVSQLLAIASALSFALATDAYRSWSGVRRAHLTLMLPVAIWFLLAPVALGARAAIAPGHIVIGLSLAIAGGGHLRIMRSERLLGAGVLGTALVFVALTNVWLALGPTGTHERISDAFILQLALYFVMALGMQLMTFEDMTYELRRANGRLEAAQVELRQRMVTDTLTGCRNRRFFDEVITHELNTHRRYGTPLSLLFIDVDRFKTINDTFGHAAGDLVLREVAGFLVRNTRNADYVFRWGGDEFLLLMSCREEEALGRGVALQQAFEDSPAARDLPDGVALSFGCAEVTQNAETVSDALKLADQRMYKNKRRVRMPHEQAV